MIRCRGVGVLLMALLGGVTPGRAQETSVGAAIRSLAVAASDVIVGQVVAIQRHDGVVDVVFHVDATLQGSAQDSFKLREWAGLWPPGMQRYAIGQRVMLFAHAASAAGLSTPVRGSEGVVPLALDVSAGSGAGTVLLDMTRLASTVVRSPGKALVQGSVEAVTLDDAAALVRGCRQPRWREPGLRVLPIRVVPKHAMFEALPLAQGDVR